MKSFFGFGLLWGAYLLAYYGWTCIQHKGVGIIDLAFPSHMPALVAILANGPAAAQAAPSGVSSGALQPATAQQLGGPLGVGLFLPTPLSGQQ